MFTTSSLEYQDGKNLRKIENAAQKCKVPQPENVILVGVEI
jgi:hypothetical protein